jgi:hypothetical protein
MDERCWSAFKAFWNDGPTCLERVKLSCTIRFTAPGVNHTSNDVIACANQLAALSCDKYNDEDHWPEACTPPPGQLADGAACIVPGQCQGSACNIRNSASCGVCKTVPRTGGACSDDVECFNFLPCVNGVCSFHPQINEPCDTLQRTCGAGTVCKNLDAAGVGVCSPPLQAGASCDPLAAGGDECDVWQGYSCDQFAKTCKRGPDAPAVGESCIEFGFCSFAAFCASDGKCKPNPREGEPCLSGQVDCMTPARCVDGMCKIRDAAVCK